MRRQGFCDLGSPGLMHIDVYSPREMARAAGVSEVDVRAALAAPDGPVMLDGFVRHADAVFVGRRLAAQALGDAGSPLHDIRARSVSLRRPLVAPMAVSSTLHVLALGAILLVATFNLAPRAQSMSDLRANDAMRLVFLATPGPGGGGGGGGLRELLPPPKARREGRRAISSPVPPRPKPALVHETPRPIDPPPLASEQLPVVVAPIVTAPADTRTRPGVLEQTTAENDAHGPGQGGGAGTGSGTGLGAGDGSGVGPGTGGGTGGGPYRPGSGITPPRLRREVRADYTEDARRQGISGEVVLEIVVRRDGSVGDVRVLQGLGGGLNDRAVQAVRQWQFSPAERRGTPVDVIVEVAVEFKLR